MISFYPYPILTTERLRLRQITIEELDEFFILKSDERLLKGYDAKPRTYEEARQKLISDNEGIAANEWINWGITLKTENKLIGSICFWNISEKESKAEIGYELMAEWQRKGIMQEAIQAVMEYGFKVMKLKLIEALPNPNNTSSVKLLERNGFVRGADFFEVDHLNGKHLDRTTYSLTSKGHCHESL